MSVLVIAEHNNSELLLGTLNTVTAARKFGRDIHILVAGTNCREVVTSASKIVGVVRVLCCDSVGYSTYITENLANLVKSQLKKTKYTHVMAPGSVFGKTLIPYIAGLFDVQAISNIIDVVDMDTFVRPIYAGNAIATVKSSDWVKMMTVRTTAFELADFEKGNAEVIDIEEASRTNEIQCIEQILSKSERPELTTAKIVISGGSGMRNGENFEMLEKLADYLGGAVGASRAAVDAGFVSNDYQVGQTGKIVAPDLYIAVGISGAIQHLAGMKDSKVIVAINNDAEAPIFKIADYCWKEDLFTAIPALLTELENSIS